MGHTAGISGDIIDTTVTPVDGPAGDGVIAGIGG